MLTCFDTNVECFILIYQVSTMSWFDAAGLTSLAKSALKEAQRTIDKALDIEENDENIQPPITPSATTPKGKFFK